ncbi:MAG: iron-only hydrogenase system regulator [Clostridiaceae bacterium]|nr:iron-only hydrogenase system regulator [Clostridiaceae bacterium]
MVKKFAVIGVVLDNPHDVQKEFNEIVSDFSHIVKGRMGLPFESHSVAVISIIVLATLDEINNFTGKLGKLKGVSVKAAISKKDIIE